MHIAGEDNELGFGRFDDLANLRLLLRFCGFGDGEVMIGNVAEILNVQSRFWMVRHDTNDIHIQLANPHAVQQIADLIDQGVDGLHFYVLNKSDATSAILKAAEITARLP